MKYAIPVNSGKVAQHFGHCEQFALIDADEGKRIVLRKEFLNSPKHEPGLLPQWLAEKGVDVIFTGGMGSRAQQLFAQNNIKVITGIMEIDPEIAVISFLNGNLATGNNLCDH